MSQPMPMLRALRTLLASAACLLTTAPTSGAEVPYDVFPTHFHLHRDSSSAQLVVSQPQPSGHRADRTPDAQFRSLTPNIVGVSPSGQVQAAGERAGTGRIRVSLEGRNLIVDCHVHGLADSDPPDFDTEIEPILAKLGCSTGACHGKQGGQNGFQLSLLGFDREFDYTALTREARGRRIFLPAPEKSLILKKAIAELPHGGGRRTAIDQPAYQQLAAWIRSGAPRHGSHPVSLQSLEVLPSRLTLAAEDQHRLVVVATFTDGSRRDVTRLAALNSNEAAIAQVIDGAIVRSGNLPGEAAIMARFLDQITACHVLIPRSEPVPVEAFAHLPVNNRVDPLVWDKLQALQILPSPRTSDAKFLRRAYIDITGRLPPPEVVRSFLSDHRPDKREQLIDSLLQHPGYADHWANKWVDLLRPNPYRVGIKAVLSFDNWIRQAFRENRPYDQFVTELLTAQGSTWRNGATTLFRDRRSPDELASMVSQLFLGVRLECARCHHHPFEVWSQDDFYAFAAYFGRVGRKGTGLSPPISGGEEIVFVADSGKVVQPRSGQTMRPRPPGEEAVELPPNEDPRSAMVRWMTADDNPYFASVIANRVWADLMGRGLVEPVDDLRATNPASNQPLLEMLADTLRMHDYNLKELIRLITTSYVYGLASVPNNTNREDHRNYSRHYRQRLRAEVLADAINDITLATDDLNAMPPGARTNEIWTHRVPSLFLDTFGRPDPNQDPPCERTRDTAVVQALHLMNSPALHAKVTSDQGRAARLAASKLNSEQIVQQLYLRVYARYPSDDELRIGSGWIDQPEKSRREGVEDLLWALINSAEFVFND